TDPGTRTTSTRFLREPLGELVRNAQHCDGSELFRLVQIQDAEIRLADARRLLEHRPKNRLELARRARDGLEHLPGRSLLFERFGQLALLDLQLRFQRRAGFVRAAGAPSPRTPRLPRAAARSPLPHPSSPHAARA